jgi:energy-coupling factor transporter ATP-binding protein EcfA2
MLHFTLSVENFGKIKQASCSITDMTFFIGDNNSGKSYLMTLLYGIMSRSFFNFLLQNIETKGAYFIPKVESLISQDNATGRIFLTVDDIQVIEDIINKVLDEKKDLFINQLFNRNIPIGKISLTFAKDLRIAFASKNGLSNNDIVFSIENYQFGYKSAFYNTDDGYGMKISAGVSSKGTNPDYHIWTAFLICHAVNILLGTDGSFTPVYLPASRTGFMLTYKTIIGDSIESKFSINQKDNNRDMLTMPVVEFLKTISSLTDKDDNISTLHKPAISFIEKNILNGRIIAIKMPVSDYLYLPDGVQDALPLYVSSGVVTEITPLLLILKHTSANCLIVEEPEISLHPSLQHKMARALVKIFNSGISVIVSTHSDIILQHIDNMIGLNNRSDRDTIMAQMKYDADDIIDAEKVSVYQFSVKQNVTEIDKIEWNRKDGFRAQTFIDSLSEILRETTEITSEED